MIPAAPLRTTAHEGSVREIAGWIVTGRFGPGNPLPTEGELGAELGVSRTVVREAIKALAAKGMVSTRPRTGTRVRPARDWHILDPAVIGWIVEGKVDRALVSELVEMRHAIEPFAAGVAAMRRSEEDVAKLRAALAAMTLAAEGDGSGYNEADLAFHRTLLRATGNRFLAQMLPTIEAVLRLSFELSVTNMSSARASLPDHAAVAEAIAARNPAAAQAALTRIIVSAEQDILTRIDAREHGRRRP